MGGLFWFVVVASGFGLLLGATARRFPANPDALVRDIEDRLPQIQCAQCGYPGCRPYAEAIAAERAPINLCPPGGQGTIDALAELLALPAVPLDPGVSREEARDASEIVAQIDEAECIGCAVCLDACPVDAILGAHRYMHTVLTDECTGCELCVEPCPVDCIEMVPSRGVAGYLA